MQSHQFRFAWTFFNHQFGLSPTNQTQTISQIHTHTLIRTSNMVVNIKFLIVFTSWHFFLCSSHWPACRKKREYKTYHRCHKKNSVWSYCCDLHCTFFFVVALKKKETRRSSLWPILCSFLYSSIVQILCALHRVLRPNYTYILLLLFHIYISFFVQNNMQRVWFAGWIRLCVYAHFFLIYARIILNIVGQLCALI